MTLTRFGGLAAALTCAAFLGACASGPATVATSASATQATTAAAEPDVGGKIIVYRTQVLGFAVQPMVSINGVDVGRCSPRQSFAVKVPAGTHTLSAQTLQKRSATVTTDGVNNAYVECRLTTGLLVGGVKLTPVAPGVGRAAVAKIN